MPQIRLDDADAVDGRHLRAVAFQEVRLEYVRSLGVDGGRAAVIGSGRGDLARGLARIGFQVDAVDPSAAATALARQRDDGSPVVHRSAPAADTGLPGASYDLVYCADTFEITDDLPGAVAEAARLLAPAGMLVFDTVNRTLLSRLVYLGGFQGIPATRIVPRGRYSAARLRPPEELGAVLERHGLHMTDICPFEPRGTGALVRAVLDRRAGRITDDQVGDAVGFRLAPGHAPLVTYLGCAVRR
jgi:2-polyprenyl-6-hydroxyphenyl methylase/3-demethylubiquinone-9 3-methyltransferase